MLRNLKDMVEKMWIKFNRLSDLNKLVVLALVALTLFLLFKYLAELEKMAKAKIKVEHIRTVKNFALKVQKLHLDFVFEYIEMQKVISTKRDEIIAL